MYKGSVEFVAAIRDGGLCFPRFDFDPHEPGVDKAEIEGSDGFAIRSTVHLTTVKSRAAGIDLATKVNTAVLNRIAYFENIAIEKARVERDDFVSLHAQSGVLVADTGEYSITGSEATFIVHRDPARLKEKLEQPNAPCERYYGLMRSARQSESPIEEFMHLYHILLMKHNDRQRDVDAFILREDPSVPTTGIPRLGTGKCNSGRAIETVYTRLRNEFAHNRTSNDLEQTKTVMKQRLPELRTLVRQAIERAP